MDKAEIKRRQARAYEGQTEANRVAAESRRADALKESRRQIAAAEATPESGCRYPLCKCIVSTSTSAPTPKCPQGREGPNTWC